MPLIFVHLSVVLIACKSPPPLSQASLSFLVIYCLGLFLPFLTLSFCLSLSVSLSHRQSLVVQGPVHTGDRAPCNTRTQIIEHIVVNGSVHTGCTQHQRVYSQMCLRLLCELAQRYKDPHLPPCFLRAFSVSAQQTFVGSLVPVSVRLIAAFLSLIALQ